MWMQTHQKPSDARHHKGEERSEVYARQTVQKCLDARRGRTETGGVHFNTSRISARLVPGIYGGPQRRGYHFWAVCSVAEERGQIRPVRHFRERKLMDDSLVQKSLNRGEIAQILAVRLLRFMESQFVFLRIESSPDVPVGGRE